jgi:hypothetical protein
VSESNRISIEGKAIREEMGSSAFTEEQERTRTGLVEEAENEAEKKILRKDGIGESEEERGDFFLEPRFH